MTKISTALSKYEPYYERILRTGSRVICSPPPEDTDDDYLVLCTPQQRLELESRLMDDGWQLGGSLPNGAQTHNNLNDPEPFVPDMNLNTVHEYKNGVIDQSRVFHSWKRWETPAVFGPSSALNSWLPSVISISAGPEINLLVTCNEQYFDDFTRATFLCQGLNLLDKADRVIVFEALTRDVWPIGRKKKKKNTLFGKSYDYMVVDKIGASPGQQALQATEHLINPPVIVNQTGNAIPIDLGPGINNPPPGWWNNVLGAGQAH